MIGADPEKPQGGFGATAWQQNNTLQSFGTGVCAFWLEKIKQLNNSLQNKITFLPSLDGIRVRNYDSGCYPKG